MQTMGASFTHLAFTNAYPTEPMGDPEVSDTTQGAATSATTQSGPNQAAVTEDSKDTLVGTHARGMQAFQFSYPTSMTLVPFVECRQGPSI